MQQSSEGDAVIARYDALFSHGWRTAYARALGISRESLSRLRGPSLIYATALVEFFESEPPTRWPPRWAELIKFYSPGRDRRP